MTSSGPFALLVRLFAGRVFYGSGDSEAGELGFSTGIVLSLIALPGAFYSFFLMEKYSTLLQWLSGRRNFDALSAVLPDEYFFIVLSMAVTGAVAVWRWHSIFPDRRDYLNLVPLPISAWKIFRSNLAAIVLLALTLAIDVNAVSFVLFPVVVGASQNSISLMLHLFWIHLFIVVLASLFSFFSVFAFVGLLMVALPYGVFRAISLYVRTAIMSGLVAILMTSFAVPGILARTPNGALRLLPSVWFLGLCQRLEHHANSAFAGPARIALIASALVPLAAVLIYAISYRAYFVRIPETVDIFPGQKRTPLSWVYRILDSRVLRTPYQRAAYRFAMHTLFRSERHGLVLAAFLGFGIVVACQFLFPSVGSSNGGRPDLSVGILAVPLILSYCIVLGVRFVLDIPAETQANWIFRLYAAKTADECAALGRTFVLSFVLPWVFIIVVPLFALFWGWRAACMQIIVVLLWSLLLTDTLLFRFRKVPFTCSYPNFRQSGVLQVLLCILGFFVFVVATSNLEYWGLANPAVVAVPVALVVFSWLTLVRLRRTQQNVEKELVFEEKAEQSFELLDLRRGA